MGNDYGTPFAIFGVGVIIIIVIYLGILALMLWIGYLLMRTAVKNGVLLAMRESGGQLFGARPVAPRPTQPPYPSAPPSTPPATPPTFGA